MAKNSFNKDVLAMQLGKELVQELSKEWGRSAKKALQLIEQGADLTRTAKGWETAQWAAFYGMTAVVEALAEKGVNMNKKHNGETPLGLATHNGKNRTVEVILNNKANVNKADCHGKTPIMTAASYGNLKLVRSFMKAGANTSKFDKTGKDVFWYAQGCDYGKVTPRNKKLNAILRNKA